jgi:glycosyltransferase involved in cell wall biosynthesis
VLSPHGGLQHLGKHAAKVIFDSIWGKRILRDAAALCAISPLEEGDARQLGIEDERIRRFPSPIDANPYKELPTPGEFASRLGLKDRKIVLFLGRLHWIKGPDILLEAINLMRDVSGLHAVIAGPDDGAEVRLRSLVREKKLKDLITFTGFLDDNQKLKALMDSYVVVVPSRREGFPITMLEALACAKPVVVSSACDLEDWIQGRATWLTFRNGDPSDLAEKLKTVLWSVPDQNALLAARSFVLSEFSSDALAAKAEELYESLLQRSHHGKRQQ